jgi:DNA-binding HxlR family transcriptional regulator
MKKTQIRRSECPINFSLEIFGDSWSLLIIRDIIYFGKKTFGEFISSNEGIARNILTNRLSILEYKDIISKKTHPSDRRKEVYELTDIGLDLIPILLDIAEWGARHAPSTDAPESWLAKIHENRESMIELIRETVREGGSIFVGSNSVINKLQSC